MPANVAGLLLARAAGRRKELAIRLALGAGGSTHHPPLLTENLVIAFFGGALGLLLAYWGIAFVRGNMNFNEAMSVVPLSLDSNERQIPVLIPLLQPARCHASDSGKEHVDCLVLTPLSFILRIPDDVDHAVVKGPAARTAQRGLALIFHVAVSK